MRPLLAIIGIVIVFITIAFVTSSMHTTNFTPPAAEAEQSNPPKPAFDGESKETDPSKLMSFEEVKEGAITATLEFEGKGAMTLDLYPKAAPKTVAHIVDLCKKNFYEGMVVHRVENTPGFGVFQVGDPLSKKVDAKKLHGMTTSEVSSLYGLGNQGSGTTVPLEAHLSHKIYSVGLARSNDLGSGDSQFYVNTIDNSKSLDGKYCVFGRIVAGQELASKIQIGDKIKSFSVK